MNKAIIGMDSDTLYGYLLLAEEGLTAYNSKYVQRYGTFTRCLHRIKQKPRKATTDYLIDSYTESANSAKFFATYPMDLSNKTPTELRRLRKEFIKNGGKHGKSY